MKRIDKLGRIVIPSGLREKYRLAEGTQIEFLDIGDGIAIKSSGGLCRMCHSKISGDASFPLCEECVMKVVKSYHEKTQS